MDPVIYENAERLWDYMHLHMALQPSECILGFGSYDLETARRCAQLYLEGWAPRILFTGNVGRNTRGRFKKPEAEYYRDVAAGLGVPESAILLETEATNTGENIRFSRPILEALGITRIIAVSKPYMERRIQAALGVCWPEAQAVVTSPQLDLMTYIARSQAQGLDEKRVLEIMMGDFQRLELYAKKGFQLPQQIPKEAWEAFYALKDLGFTRELL